ncbi:hypothetical protein FISHEDRAFT_34869 [Fistulina hepatica ATCC 64428]|uniref:RING-type domain-containing protein n=1 Tax=Fistulina hepatica ATCC 64428 TaxID=1128425 RepID=A0A0D7APD3_9AGAR|nr:hypothetical protein FISHEDRAFT_34869 [Fistulina hepatica ATCC 64428]
MASTYAKSPVTLSTPKRLSKAASNQSINHLLNFTLPPRQALNPSSLPRRSRKTAHYGVWNKERFVNAQYRFVMNPMGDYTVHFADPDIFFQWQDILQVIIPRSSALAVAATTSAGDEGHTSCPICLSPPTAPRMTKCGHVFCFPCILHYLNTSESKWARCPICGDTINEKELKSVKWFDESMIPDFGDNAIPGSSSTSAVSRSAFVNTPDAGTSMYFRLMQRPQITTLSLPRSSTWPSDLLPPHQAPFHFLPDVFIYAKFMLATPGYLVQDLTSDLDELALERRAMRAYDDELGQSFIDAAETKVRLQIEKAHVLETPLFRSMVDKAYREWADIRTRTETALRRRNQPSIPGGDVPQELMATKSTSIASFTSDSVRSSSTAKQRRNVNPPPPSTSTYHFYQTNSGLPIYLHPLDIKILHNHFALQENGNNGNTGGGSYASLPDTLELTISHSTPSTVTPDLRKRCKYLSHLPEGADVIFVEIDERSLEAVVGADGVRPFEGALRTRIVRRREKERKEERRERAQAQEHERAAHAQASAHWIGAESARRETRTPSASPPPSVEEPVPPVDVPQVSGAWGSRSFASTLVSANPGHPRRRELVQDYEQDEYDLDVAWHELEEQRVGGNTGVGRRRKKANRMVVLGGDGGRRR